MTGLWRQRRRAMRGNRRAVRSWTEQVPAQVLTLVALVAVWLALWGDLTIPLVVVGVLLAALVLAVFPLPPVRFRLGFHPWRMIVLISRFAYDVVAASFQVAYLALRPRAPTTDVVTVELVSDSDLIQHLTALAVSLIPGSLIVDADPNVRTLTIHVLYTSPRPAGIFISEVLAQEERFIAALGASRGGGHDRRRVAGTDAKKEEQP